MVQRQVVPFQPVFDAAETYPYALVLERQLGQLLVHTSTYGKTDGVSLRPSSQLFDLLMFWMHSLPLANLHSLQPWYCGAPSQPAAADRNRTGMLFVLIWFIFKLSHILQAINVVPEPSACRMAPVVVDLDIQDILNIPKERQCQQLSW